MSMMEFYNNPVNQSTGVKKVGIEFPENEIFVRKYVEGVGGHFLTVAGGYGEALIPESRIATLREVRPHYIINEI